MEWQKYFLLIKEEKEWHIYFFPRVAIWFAHCGNCLFLDINKFTEKFCYYKIQIGSDDLPFRSAFKNVIFNRSWNLNVETPLGVIQNKLDEEGIGCSLSSLVIPFFFFGRKFFSNSWCKVLFVNCHFEKSFIAFYFWLSAETVLVQFRICCPNIEEDTSVWTLFSKWEFYCLFGYELILFISSVGYLCRFDSW